MLQLEKISKEEQKTAFEALKMLENVFKKNEIEKEEVILIHVNNEKSIIPIPKRAFCLFYYVLKAVSEKKNVVLSSHNEEMSILEFADMLNISYPYAIRLVKTGEVPCKKIGKHRRITYEDALIYQEKYQKILPK